MSKTVTVIDIPVSILDKDKEQFVSITDIARYRDVDRSDYIIQNWMRRRDTIEFIGLWEVMNNTQFKSIEFDGFKNEAGSNSFSLTPKRWVEATNAIGLFSKKGRYGGTYAHIDIAFEFASWISPQFKLYLIQEFKRLKTAEYESKSQEWNVSRTLSKVNYAIHTDAIKNTLIPKLISQSAFKKYVYADEADLLNVALFSTTAKEWRQANKGKKGNMRDHATLEQLVVLSNLESFNAELIKQGIDANKRFAQLNKIAVDQMQVLTTTNALQQLK